MSVPYFSSQQLELVIYYLYLYADGSRTSDEDVKFDLICKSMAISDDDVKEVKSYCNRFKFLQGEDNSNKINSSISRILSESCDRIFDDNMFNFFNKHGNKEKKKIKIIWNLVSLGNADGDYSQPEKNVVDFLCDLWEVSQDTVKILIDTAESIKALNNYKEWLKTINKPYNFISERVNKTEEQIKKMEKSIELLLADAEIA